MLACHTTETAAEEIVLGVERSVSGRRWLSRTVDGRPALEMAQRLGLPEVLSRLLVARGVGIDQVEAFLKPTLRATLPDPSLLADMDVAAERLASAVAAGQRVAVFADYDVDGATSAALLSRFFAALGRSVRIYVPDRLNEGYGPSSAAMRQLRDEGAAVVVTVDCGTTSHDALAAAAEVGLDVIVVDHHKAEATLPPALAVVNPNRPDDESGQGHLAAVGVTFMLVVAVNRALRARGFYTLRSEPDLRCWLDLVALGTLCDLVPLSGVNRALVVQGLKVMAAWSNCGLKALADVAGLGGAPASRAAGFILGPRINAGGRVGDADLGARLLACEDVAEAADLARRLDLANRARREIESAVFDQALAQLMARPDAGSAVPVLIAAGKDWHPGVVGIVASRLVERFDLPVCVVALRDGVGTGSGRSIRGVDLGNAIIAARNAGLLLRGGGHPMAAGFAVAEDRLEALRAFLADQLVGSVAVATQAPALRVDGALAIGGSSPELAAMVLQAGPFGSGNPEPRFAIGSARILHTCVVHGGHVRCMLGDHGGNKLQAIAFRSASGPVGKALLQCNGAPVHVAGRLCLDEYRDRCRTRLLIDDVASPVAQRT